MQVVWGEAEMMGYLRGVKFIRLTGLVGLG